ncbi:trypsin-like serine protease [Streptomyces sp. NPDC005899]|uniref:trypsin-like serine protease n=1 Tax=Streptomyces sp. NPDC005899 TaxID=3155716 RepID=UPI0033D5B08E
MIVPTVAVVAGMIGTGFTATGAQASEPGGKAQITRSGDRVNAPSQSELRIRAARSMQADQKAKSTPAPSALASDGTGAARKPDPKIIGGSETTISAAPWMAQLHFFDDKDTADTSDDVGYFCGGSVVAPSKVVTAAHCVKGFKWYLDSTVIVGTDQLPTDTGEVDADGYPVFDFHGGQLRGAYRQWNHPAYDDVTIDNDVAVLTLTSPVNVKPLPIMRNTDTAVYNAGTAAKVYGWGRTSSTEEGLAQTLKVAPAAINTNAACQAAWGTNYVVGHMVCAGSPGTGSDAGTTTACNGDSGGPLVANGMLVGVVSWGAEDCSAQGAYSVYAKMSTYSAPVKARVYDANLNNDHAADLFARLTSSGALYEWDSSVTKLTRKYNWGSAGMNLLVQTDLDRDDNQDLLYRNANGDVYWDHWVPSTGDWGSKLVAKGWKAHKQILSPGDLTNDGLADMLAVNSSGNLYLYAGKGDGGFLAPTLVGGGWGQYNMVRGHGDFTNDGKPDVLARASDGSTYLYKGTSNAAAPFEARVKVATFGGLNMLATTGDVNSDGHADLLGRDTAGKLWLYPGNGKSSGAIFATRVAFGTGWGSYNLFG